MKWVKASIKPPTGNAEDYSWRRVRDKKKFNPILNINDNVLEYEWLRSEFPFDEVEYLDETESDAGEIETLKAENGKMRQALEKSLEWIADIKQKDIPLDDKKGMALYHIKWLATEALNTNTHG